MISLRKHIDRFQPGLGEPELAAFRAMLLAIGHCGERAVPSLGPALSRKMAELREKLVQPAGAGVLARTSEQVETELSGWADRALEHQNEIERELSEIIGVVASAAHSVSERDQKYAREIGDLTGRLGSIAEMNDLALVRRSIVESTRALKACVEKMAEDSRASVHQLSAEVTEYRARLEESERISATDPLTELANRRAFERQLEARIAGRRPFCLIMIDLDDFKTVNDRLGHVAGDDLLKQFALELKSQFTASDLVGRWGGDEFVAIVAGALNDAEEKVERIRRWAFGEYKIRHGNQTVKTVLKASVGLAEWNGDERGVELVARADKGVYKEKESVKCADRVAV